MGKPTSSCLKIIACGSDTAQNDDDIDSPQAKGSSDKRGWSFRKKSGRHRVLANNLNSETPSFADKQVPQDVKRDFQEPSKSAADEKLQLPKSVEKGMETDFFDDKQIPQDFGTNLQEPAKITATDGKPQLAKSVEEGTDTTMAPEHVSRTIADVIASENGSDPANAEPEHTLPVATLQNHGDATSIELKMADEAVASINESEIAVSDSETSDIGVFSNIDDRFPSESKALDSVSSENIGDVIDTIDEAESIIIQAAIRGFLARSGFLQLKSTVKLQAAIRGHLVRRDAVETLQCIRGIVKFQALVRARSSKLLDQENKPRDAKFSTVKLLRNSFACQLFESTPKPKSMNIRCDPLRPDSAWAWLERWMSVTTPEIAHKSEQILETEEADQIHETFVQADGELPSMLRFESVASRLEIEEADQVHETSIQSQAELPSMLRFESVASRFSSDDEAVTRENEDALTSQDLNSEYSLPHDSMSEEEKAVHSEYQKIEISPGELDPMRMDSYAKETSESQAEPIYVPADIPAGHEQPKLSTKRLASKELDCQGKKFAYGSRNASNLAFFSTESNSGRSSSITMEDPAADCSVDTTCSMVETSKETNEPSIVKEDVLSDPGLHAAGSESETELSISSTLDSPDRFDGNTEADLENKVLEDASCDINGKKAPDSENDLLNSYVADAQAIPDLSEDVRKSSEGFSVPSDVQMEQNIQLESDMSNNSLTDVRSVSDLPEHVHKSNEESIILSDVDVSSKMEQNPEHESGVLLDSYVADAQFVPDLPEDHKSHEESVMPSDADISIQAQQNLQHESGVPDNCGADVQSVPYAPEDVRKSNEESVTPSDVDISIQVDQNLQHENSDSSANFKSVDSVKASDGSRVEQIDKQNGDDVPLGSITETDLQSYKTPVASPKSFITISDSQGTPASQASVKGKRNNKSGSNTKRNSLSGGKKSLSNPALDSGHRSSTENLLKDNRSAKRRNSIGSTKSDSADQDARDNINGSSLPSYMQATESARAKALSPKSSPDVHEKEAFIKKRHSLPGANGRQGSPRIQRSTSEAAQGEKPNGSNSKNERKWQR